MRDAENETTKVRDTNDPDRIPKNRTIDEEQPPQKPLRTPGDSADNAAKATDNTDGGGGNGASSKPTSDVGKPDSPEAPDKNLPWKVRIAINAGLGGVGSVISDTLHGVHNPVKIVEDAVANTVTGSAGGISTRIELVLGGDALGAGAGSAFSQLNNNGSVNRPKTAIDATFGGLAGVAGRATELIEPLVRSFGEDFGEAIANNIGYGVSDLGGNVCTPSNAVIGQGMCPSNSGDVIAKLLEPWRPPPVTRVLS